MSAERVVPPFNPIIGFPAHPPPKGLEPEKGGAVLAGGKRYSTRNQEAFRTRYGYVQVKGSTGKYQVQVVWLDKPIDSFGDFGSIGQAVGIAKSLAERERLAFNPQEDVCKNPI